MQTFEVEMLFFLFQQIGAGEDASEMAEKLFKQAYDAVQVTPKYMMQAWHLVSIAMAWSSL